MTDNDDTTRKLGEIPDELLVGRRLRELRNASGFSLRVLAGHSGLNVNTLSLMRLENPLLCQHLQHLAKLALPITAFLRKTR